MDATDGLPVSRRTRAGRRVRRLGLWAVAAAAVATAGLLLLAGRDDNMIPQDSTQRLAVLLEHAGASVTLEWRNTGHRLEQTEFTLAREWLDRHFR